MAYLKRAEADLEVKPKSATIREAGASEDSFPWTEGNLGSYRKRTVATRYNGSSVEINV